MRLRAAAMGLATLALGMTQIAPALASHQPSTASLDRHEVVAGAQGVQIALTVSHPAAGFVEGITSPPRSLNEISVQLPAGVLGVASAQGPSGWSMIRLSSTHVRFFGGSLNAGQSAVFRFTVDAAAPADDRCADWHVTVSSDGGTTNQAATGSLETCVRVIEISAADPVAPEGAKDGSVTEGQEGVCIRVRLRAAGSAPLSVVPKIAIPGASVGGSRAAAEPPCSGASANSVALQPGESGAADFPVTFGAAGTTSMSATAKAGPSAASPVSRPLWVQRVPRFSYVANSLTPRMVQPGEQVGFSVQIQQAEPAASAIELFPATTFGFEGFSSELGKTIVQAGLGTVQLSFPKAEVPASEAFFPAAVALQGVDANGKPFTAQVATGEVAVGAAIKVEPRLTAPKAACCVPPEDPAVKNGDDLSWSVSVWRVDPDDQQLEPCSDCTVMDRQLVQHADAACGPTTGTAISLPPGAPPGGTNSGTYRGSYAPPARSIDLVARVRVGAGTEATGRSNCIDVDNIRPTVIDAVTARDPMTGRIDTLHITFDSCVAGGGMPLDWGLAWSETPHPPEPGCTRGVRVQFVNEFPEDPPLPSIRYRPTVESQRYRDRVGLPMIELIFAPRDGISPGIPSIDSVSTGEPSRTFGLQEGQFVTSLLQPRVSLSGLDSDTYRVVELWAETGLAGGLQRGGEGADRRVGAGGTQSPSAQVTADLAGFPDTGTDAVLVYAVAIDPGSNVSDAAVAPFLLDRAAPAFRWATMSGDQLTVRFSEFVPRGRNSATDWELRGRTASGQQDSCLPSSVQAGVASDTRILTFDNCPVTDPQGIDYTFLGSTSQRYEDRATNVLDDFTAAVT